MKLNFAIGIPTINRYDLLKEALERYYFNFPNTKIFIIDNGKQHIDQSYPNITLYESTENLGVAKSWNKLCDLIFEQHEYALILNDDVVFGKKEHEIQTLLETEKYDFYVGPFYWSAFILPKQTFGKVGKFDTIFYPAFYEDNDYHMQMKLLHLSYYQTDILKPEVERNSMTIKKDPSLNKDFERNKELYIKKWGGEPGDEKFITSFNKNIVP